MDETDKQAAADRRELFDRRDADLALKMRELRELREFIAEENVRHPRNDQSLDRIETGVAELSGPGGWKAKFTGVDTKIVLLALLIVACLSYFGFETYRGRLLDVEARDAYLNNHKITQDLLKTVVTNQHAILVAIGEAKSESDRSKDELVYVMSLSPEKRNALKLEMPWTLRQKLGAK